MFTATLDDLYYQVTYTLYLYGFFLSIFLKGSFILSFIILFMYVFLAVLSNPPLTKIKTLWKK